MKTVGLIDTNVLVRHITGDHPTHSPLATSMIGELDAGMISAHLSTTVLFETVYLLEKQYRMPRTLVVSVLHAIVKLPNVILDSKEFADDVFELFVRHRALSIADCFHAVLARTLTPPQIVSFDRGFDRVDGITRIEPA